MSQGVTSVSEGSSTLPSVVRRVWQRLEPSLTLVRRGRLGDPIKRRRRAVGLLQKSPPRAWTCKALQSGSIGIGFGD